MSIQYPLARQGLAAVAGLIPLVLMTACAGSSSVPTPSQDGGSKLTIEAATDGSFSVTPEFFNTPDAYQLLIDAHGSAKLPFGTFLIPGDEPVLIDAGLGPDFPPIDGVDPGHLLESLTNLGVEPADIKHLVLSHLHADHTGWLATKDGGITFPNAQVYVGEADWEDRASAEPLAPWTTQALQDLYANERVTLISDEREIVPGVTAIPAPGHTRGHTVVTVEAVDGRTLIAGDALYFPEQLTDLDLSAAHDLDPQAALATRTWLHDESENGALILAPHFPRLAG